MVFIFFHCLSWELEGRDTSKGKLFHCVGRKTDKVVLQVHVSCTFREIGILNIHFLDDHVRQAKSI